MEVILQENYPSLGYVGDRVKVRRGFARNYLLPRGIAVEAGSSNARLLAHRLSGINSKKAKLKSEAEQLAAQLAEVSLDFVMKLGTHGKSFGAVTLRDIELFLEQKNFKLERKQLRLNEAIKAPGNYVLHVKLHSEVGLDLPVKVTAEKVAPAAGSEQESGRRARRKGKDRSEHAETGDDVAKQNAAESEEHE